MSWIILVSLSCAFYKSKCHHLAIPGKILYAQLRVIISVCNLMTMHRNWITFWMILRQQCFVFDFMARRYIFLIRQADLVIYYIFDLFRNFLRLSNNQDFIGVLFRTACLNIVDNGTFRHEFLFIYLFFALLHKWDEYTEWD